MSVETLRNQSKAKITLLQQRQKNTLDKTKKNHYHVIRGQFHTKLLENSFTIMESVNEMTRSRIEFIIELVSLEVSC